MSQILNEKQILNIFQDTLNVLGTIGVAFDKQSAIDLFIEHGFKVKGNRVCFTQKQVEDAMKLAATADYSDLSKKRVAVGSVFGTAPMIYDDKKGICRRGTVEDAVLMYELVQTSDLYESVNPGIAEPLGIEEENGYLPEMAFLLKHTDKWLSNGLRATARNSVGGDIYRSQKNMLNMIRRFYDTWNEPVMSQGICPMSPLRFDRECMDNLDATIEEKQRMSISVCTLTALTGPSGLVDMMVHDLALGLAGLVYASLRDPEVKIKITTASTMTDMRCTQAAYGSPETVFLSTMFFEICKYFNIGCSVCATLSDAAKPNYQAGVESMLSSLMPYLVTDIDVIWAYTGHMAAWFCGSFEKAIYDEEVMRYVNRCLKGVHTEVSPDYMDIIANGVEHNTFMTGRTPKQYRRDHYISQIFSKYGVRDDMPDAQTDISLRAWAEIKRRHEMYQLPERTAEQKKILNEYLPEQYKYR